MRPQLPFPVSLEPSIEPHRTSCCLNIPVPPVSELLSLLFLHLSALPFPSPSCEPWLPASPAPLPLPGLPDLPQGPSSEDLTHTEHPPCGKAGLWTQTPHQSLGCWREGPCLIYTLPRCSIWGRGLIFIYSSPQHFLNMSKPTENNATNTPLPFS